MTWCVTYAVTDPLSPTGLGLVNGGSILELAALALVQRGSFWHHLTEVIPVASHQNLATQDGLKKSLIIHVSNQSDKHCLYVCVISPLATRKFWCYDFVTAPRQLLEEESTTCFCRVSWSKMSCMTNWVKKLMQGSRVNSVIAYVLNSLLHTKVL